MDLLQSPIKMSTSYPYGSNVYEFILTTDHSIIPHGSNTVFEFLHSPQIIPSYPTVPTPSLSSYTHHGSFRHTPRFQHRLRVPTLTTDHSVIPSVPTPSSSSYTHHGSFRHNPQFQHRLQVPTLTMDHSVITHGSNTVFTSS